MAKEDLNLKGDLYGSNTSELKYMLLHKTSLGELTDFSPVDGQIYLDNDTLLSFEYYTDAWRSILYIDSFNSNNYLETTNRLLIGAGYARVIPLTSATNGFVRLNSNAPTIQQYITFEDILASDYTTIIVEPGLDTRFATEKAIVDYVQNSIALIPIGVAAGNNTEIQWNDNGFFGASSDFIWNDATKTASISYIGNDIIYPTLNIIRNSDYCRILVEDDSVVNISTNVGMSIYASSMGFAGTYLSFQNINITINNVFMF